MGPLVPGRRARRARPDRRRDRPAERQPRRAAGDRVRARPHGLPRAPRGDARERRTHRRRARARWTRASPTPRRRSKAAIWPNCTGCEESCSASPATMPPPKRACAWPSPAPASNRRSPSSCGRRRAWRSCCWPRPSRAKRAPPSHPVYDWFTEGHTTRDLMAARTSLDEIGLVTETAPPPLTVERVARRRVRVPARDAGRRPDAAATSPAEVAATPRAGRATRRSASRAVACAAAASRSGVIQGLARAGVLGKFDYLSTVSGGGYIGGWLTAWRFHARRARRSRPLRATRTARSNPSR